MSKNKDTTPRAVTFPLAGVDGGTTKEFVTYLRQLWREGTRAANWAVQYYARQDNVHEVGQEKMPPCPKLYAYPELVARFPLVSTGTLSAISRMTQAHYRRHRLAVWLGDEGLPLYRYPAPYPVRAQDWNPVWVHGERPGVEFGTGQPRNAGNGRRWRLVLKGGPEFRRQRGQFEQIIGGGARQADLALYAQSCGDRRRAHFWLSRPGGGQTRHMMVMVKLVAHFPRRIPQDPAGALVLRTDPGAFLVAVHDDRVVHPWVLNADQTLRWVTELRDRHQVHLAWLQRMSEDTKLEVRLHTGRLVQMLDAYQKRCDKHHRRVKSFIDMATAQVVNYCRRQRIAAVLYDDSDQSWQPRFPWAALRTRLSSLCADAGIEYANPVHPADDETAEAG